MPVDAQIVEILAKVNAANAARTSPPTIAELRVEMKRWRDEVFGAVPVAGLAVDDITIPASGGPVPARVYRPEGSTAPQPTIVYLHGGSWVMGSVDIYDDVTRRIALAADAVVVSVDYRLAPEHPFPAGWEDSRDALLWAARNIADLGGDPDALVVAGDSAGGNFGSSLSVWARDTGFALAAQLLFYPSSDLSRRYPAMDELQSGYLLETPPVDFPDRDYLVDPDLRWDPVASPLLSKSFTGLAPAVVYTAEFDPIKEHGSVLVDAYAAAGVPVVLRECPGMVHGFIGMAGSDAARDEVERACADLLEMLAR